MASVTKDQSRRAATAAEKSGDKNAEIVVFSIVRESTCAAALHVLRRPRQSHVSAQRGYRADATRKETLDA